MPPSFTCPAVLLPTSSPRYGYKSVRQLGQLNRSDGGVTAAAPSGAPTEPPALPGWSDRSVPAMLAPRCQLPPRRQWQSKRRHYWDDMLKFLIEKTPHSFLALVIFHFLLFDQPFRRRCRGAGRISGFCAPRAPRRLRCTRIVAFFSLIHTQKSASVIMSKKCIKKLEFLRPAGNPFDGRGCGTGPSHCGTVNDFAFLMNEGEPRGVTRARDL